ncbi:MAG TPA: hypothetical protein VNT79_10425 [Phycisphaerae bacterium]|nr:hypothetical protein [Phycisphaerae bacterium]
MAFIRNCRFYTVAAALGVLVAAGAECPNNNNNNNSNTNQNNNNNSNSDTNVLGLTSALVTVVHPIGDPPQILAFGDPGGLTGEVTADVTLERPNDVQGIAINVEGQLLVLTDDTIEVFATADSVSGAEPTRVVTSPILDNAAQLTYDPARDLLYVLIGFDANHSVAVFNETGSETFDGDVAPFHLINSDAVRAAPGFTLFAIAPNDHLYIKVDADGDPDTSDSKIIVYENASTLQSNSSLDPDRTITFSEIINSSLGTLSSIQVDADDNFFLIASDSSNGSLQIGVINIPAAASLDGDIIDPDFLSNGGNLLGGLAVDADGNAYLGKISGISVYNAVLGRNEVADFDRSFDTADQMVTPGPILIIE